MSTEALTILAIDDDAGDAELLLRHLSGITAFEVDFIHERTAARARQVLAARAVDVIFLDHHLGGDTGVKVLEALRASGEMRPVIAMTGQGDEYVARDLMRKGADDYLAKRDMGPDTLRRSIESALSRFHRRRLEALNRELAEDLMKKNAILEQKNRELVDLYQTAHEFVDNVSHEFRTPLTVIKEFTSILNDGLVGEVSPAQKEYLETVLDRTDDLATMIDDMLDISKLEAGLLGVARKVCSVRQVLDRVDKTLERKADSNRIRLHLPAVESLPLIYCDPEKIGRVIINLTVNAIKFSEENCEVSLWAEHDPATNLVTIGVTDHGPGIDPAKLSEIFGRFQQLGGDIRSSTRGFGLGLNIARELVHLNLGDIQVTSRVGEGSTFSFTVPTAEPLPLIDRFLNRWEQTSRGSSHVTLLTARASAAAWATSPSDVERFIQQQIRKSDMVFPAPAGGWLVAAMSDERDLHQFLQRIERAYLDANRNRPGAPLPKIEWTVAGTWPIVAGRACFLEAYQNELAPREAVHV